jgi:hypothetical protein
METNIIQTGKKLNNSQGFIQNETDDQFKAYLKSRFNSFKSNFEGKVKNRLGFLRHKICRYISEINSLIKNLYLHNFNNSPKKQYFNILKVKKLREAPKFVNHNLKCDNFEEFFNEGYDSNLNLSKYSEIGQEPNKFILFSDVFPQSSAHQLNFEYEEEGGLNILAGENIHMTSQKYAINSQENGSLPKEKFFSDSEIKNISYVFEEISKINSDEINSIESGGYKVFKLDYKKKKKYNMLSTQEKQKLVELVNLSNFRHFNQDLEKSQKCMEFQ